MDTAGHHLLAEVGEKLLKDALKRGNGKDMRIGAFYLGNWLTDVSQSVDPIAYENAYRYLTALMQDVTDLFQRLVHDAPAWFSDRTGDAAAKVTQVVVSDPQIAETAKAAVSGATKKIGQAILGEPIKILQQKLDTAQDALTAQIRALLGQGRSSKLAATFKSVFTYVGYFKFVLAEDGSTNTRMDETVYLALIESRFSQYFPHEHLDRPETGPQTYDTELSDGPFNEHIEQGMCQGDLYSYLRKDIKLAAGLLASLDGGRGGTPASSWAAATFKPGQTKFKDKNLKDQAVDDTNYEWNFHLAELGHALHAVEDFFAHSTFVEHASTALPSYYEKFQRYTDGEILVRRLKKWKSLPKGQKDELAHFADDSHVVTGYFDTYDTLNSLLHILDKAFDRPLDGVGRKLDNAANYEYIKLLHDTIKLIDNPSIIDKKTDNLAAQYLRDKIGIKQAENREKFIKESSRFLTEHGPLADKPERIKEAFRRSVVALAEVVKVGTVAFSLFKLLNELRKFMLNPLNWLRKFIPNEIYKQLKDVGEVYLKELVRNYLGAKRIGCHSLIAKDSGPELFHNAAMSCARAVDWYLVEVLTRHARAEQIEVCRCSNGKTNTNPLFRGQLIDWLELLEYFLAHPLSITVEPLDPIPIASSIVHITRKDPHSRMSPDTLESLTKKYKKSFYRGHLNGPKEWSWELIADANFPVANLPVEQKRIQINKALAIRQDMSVKTLDGINYAFRPNVKLIIPYQKAMIPRYNIKAGPKDAWWLSAILDKILCHNHHSLFSIEQAKHDAFIQEVDKLRKKLEEGYNHPKRPAII